jgi:hypothetical protein
MEPFSYGLNVTYPDLVGNFATGAQNAQEWRKMQMAEIERNKAMAKEKLLKTAASWATVPDPETNQPTFRKDRFLSYVLRFDPMLGQQFAQQFAEQAATQEQAQQKSFLDMMGGVSDVRKNAAEAANLQSQQDYRAGEAGRTAKSQVFRQQLKQLELDAAERRARIMAGAQYQKNSQAAKTAEDQKKVSAEQVIALTDDIVNDKDFAVGFNAKRLLGVLPGTQTGAFNKKVERLMAALQLEIASKLRGQGQISDHEREMLRNAATLIDRGLPEDEFMAEINRIRGVLGTGPIVRQGKGKTESTVPGEATIKVGKKTVKITRIE